MKPILVALALLLHQWTTEGVTTTSVGIIRNASLTILNTSATTINGTCEECLCALLVNSTVFSVNCFHENLTCQLHFTENQNKPFVLIDSANTAFYFVSLPTYVASQSTDSTTHEITSQSTSKSPCEEFSTDQVIFCRGATNLGQPPVSGGYLWTFDSTFQDTSSTFNGTPMNNASFSNLTITGYGSSLSLSASMNQFLTIAHPFLELSKRSWTFEAWIYLFDIQTGIEYPIAGQCENNVTDKCLHLVVRTAKLYLGFLSDDLFGTTSLTASRWYHAAFVFDHPTKNQSIYLNGVLDASREANNSYQGIGCPLDIGKNDWSNAHYFFNGLIDQFSYTNRSKASDEILRDATLTVSFSFDSNSTFDEGPLAINGSLVGNTSFVPGRRGQALQIDNVNDSYFMVQGLVLLGTNNQSYSFSIWIKPAILQKSSIIHMSDHADGNGWSLPMISLTNNGELITVAWSGGSTIIMGPPILANMWTYVAVTYSSTNGLRLYVNGTLFNSSLPYSFVGSGHSNYLLVGSSRLANTLVGWSNIIGQYSGAVDELRVYSRELTTSDIIALTN